jgi:RNA recognition motif-containing protein
MSDAPAAAVTTENGAPTVAQNQAEEVGHKVFAGNLAYSTTDEGLKTFFAAAVSDIISATVIMRGTRSAGYGFVALPTLEAAEKAVAALDKTELDGRQIIVEVAKPADQKDKEKKEKKQKRRTGRRGGKAVPGEVTEAEANGNADEAPAAGGTDEAAKPKKKKKKSPRKPKVKADGDAAAAPAPAEGDEAAAAKAARPRKTRTPRPPRPAGEDPVGEPSKNMLFVANLGFNIDEAGLQTLFTDAGINVVSARVVRRSYGKPRKSKGYGFVDVGNEEEQKKAIAALDGKDLEGRNIAVKVAVNTPQEDEGSAPAAAETKADDSEAPAAAA